ncbi:MAG: hypothetical protein MUO76_17635, partial [Anaerolineaceae bacterium]|nr:hypothetical protein [Anaerolineaceae bacterium]
MKQDKLSQRSKEELILLINEILQRVPNLSHFVDRPLPGFYKSDKPPDLSSYQKELHQAVSRSLSSERNYDNYYDYNVDYEEMSSVGEVAGSMVEDASKFGEYGDWQTSILLYELIIKNCLILDHDQVAFDDDWAIAVFDVLYGLINALDQDAVCDDHRLRKTILFALLNMLIWDIFQESSIFQDERRIEESIIEHIQPEETELMRNVILKASSTMRSKRQKRACEQLVFRLDTLSNIEPDVLLERLRQREHYQLLLEKLLDLDRLDEAIAVIEEYFMAHTHLHMIIETLKEFGHGKIGIQIGLQMLLEKFDPNISELLLHMNEIYGDNSTKLEILRITMEHSPSLEFYKELKHQAEEQMAWDELRPQIIEQIKNKKDIQFLVEILLNDEDWDAAWDVLDNISSLDLYNSIVLEAAHLSKHVYPQKAIKVFIEIARQKVNGYNRSSYRETAN